MKNEKIIDTKLFEAEEKLGKVETRKRINNFVGVLATIGCAVASFGASVGVALACLSSSALIGLLTGRDNGLKKHEISKLTQEVSHMEKLRTEGLDKNRELTLKRMFKVKELKKDLAVAEEYFKSLENKSNLFAVLSSIGIGLTAAVNPLFVIAPAIGLILTGSYALEANDANAERQYLNNRIDNLESDLNISKEINVSDIDRSKKEKTPLVKKALGNTNDKIIDPAVESAVDSYVESLTTQSEEVQNLGTLKK